MTKTQNILTDLKAGKVLNMLRNVPRYGTSMRSRISEFRDARTWNLHIIGRTCDKSGALEYFMPRCAKQPGV